MAVEKVREFLKQFGCENNILEMDESTKTVQLAAAALGTKPEQIAKTIALKGSTDGEYIIVVSAGDLRIDNKKFKNQFGLKPRMLSPDETYTATGYQVGGVCPFALPANNGIILTLDVSLKEFEEVYPACGSGNSAIKLKISELEEYTGNPEWVDVCKSRE